jgi:hypothetical protein
LAEKRPAFHAFINQSKIALDDRLRLYEERGLKKEEFIDHLKDFLLTWDYPSLYDQFLRCPEENMQPFLAAMVLKASAYDQRILKRQFKERSSCRRRR